MPEGVRMMVCKAPIQKGPLVGRTATGTRAGYKRHQRARETACPPCAEAERQYARRYYADNTEKRYEYYRRWELNNLEKRYKLNQRWRAANPEKWRGNVRQQTQKWRARKREALTVSFTSKQLAERMAYWGNCCWLCRGPYEEVDHVIALASGGAHCLSNLRPICRSCNASKGARDYRSVA